NVGFVNGQGTSTEIHNYTFTDKPVNSTNNIFYYRLKQVDMNGQSTYSKVLTVKFDNPLEYSLAQNFPNPFNPSTVIKYTVPQNGPVTIKLYDITGREVSTLVNEVKTVGSYELKFDASGLASGVYIYRMIAKDFVSVKKMSILK
ncbi:MAG TPA: T9SS type A sorting domain-containing protein, partial [Ignavibacteriaceae bacterium]